MTDPAPRGLRLATWNIAWMTRLFDAEGHMLADDAPSALRGVSRAQQLDGLAIVLPRLDADALLVVEAPDQGAGGRTGTILERVAAALGLRARRALTGFTNGTEQELALLYDPDRVAVRHDPQGDPAGRRGEAEAPRFDGSFRIDLDIDAKPDVIRFSKPPLEVALTPAGGRALRLIGVHVKSKAPHGAETPEEVLRLSIANRRKQLAQCIWLRQRAEAHLTAGEPLILMGDLNDGPGLDAFEALFGRSGLEIVMGEDGPPNLRLHDPHAHQALAGRIAPQATTARFYVEREGRWLAALLDYILVSADLAAAAPVWRIWHPFDDAAIYADAPLREALLAASDHFPVTLDLPARAIAAGPEGV